MGDMTVDELKDKNLWFLWSAKPGKNGKVTKVPFAANGGATGTDDAHNGTWVSFDDAESARNRFRASGLGLKIPKGFFLLDIDHKDISDPFATAHVISVFFLCRSISKWQRDSYY